MQTDIAIVGGGASGVFCACRLARVLGRRAKITIFEKQSRVLRKLGATGNGRCNFTNVHADVSRYYGANPAFPRLALERFTPSDAIAFFRALGVEPTEREDGKIFPLSLQASSIVDVLRFDASAHNVEIIIDCGVNEITRTFRGFDIVTVQGTFKARFVVFAAGGASAPDLGGSADCYAPMCALGHKLTELTPALVQIKTEKTPLFGLSGLKIEANVAFCRGDAPIANSFGELLFTDFGLSGSVIFALSANVGCDAAIIDFLPAMDADMLPDFLRTRRTQLSAYPAELFLNGLIHKKLGVTLLKMAGLKSLNALAADVSDDCMFNLSALLKRLKLRITGTTGFKNAQITAGGLATDDFDETLMSKKVEHLWCIGETLDVHGDCGGFNLQWAWSSAALAAERIAELC